MQLVKQRYASFSYFLILLISKSHIMKKTYIIPLTQVETAQAEMMMAVSITSINGDAGIELGDGDIVPDEADVKEYSSYGGGYED